MTSEVAEQPVEPLQPWLGLPWHVFVGTFVFFLDALVLHGFLIRITLYILLVFWFVPAALASVAMSLLQGLPGGWTGSRVMLLRIGTLIVYGITVAGIVTFQSAHRDEGVPNAAPVISGVDKFKQEHGRLPGSLQELVPQYLERIPPARSTLTCRHFIYEVTPLGPEMGGQTARLYYWSHWPYGMTYFDFQTHEWVNYPTWDWLDLVLPRCGQ
ncbi:MAG: hypothetical protein AB1646_16775 [Thermodesulfobacteriota bacterium]